MRQSLLLYFLLFWGLFSSAMYAKSIHAPQNGKDIRDVKALVTHSGDELVFYFTEYGVTSSRLHVLERLDLAKETKIRLLRAKERDAFADNGVYVLFTYQGKDPDVSAFEIQNPMFGKRYLVEAKKGMCTVRIETVY